MQPQKTAYVIGKHKSVEQFAELIKQWNASGHTYGINHAALWYGTNYAFTGHDHTFNELRGTNELRPNPNPIPPNKIILAQPFYEGTTAHISEYYAKILQNPGEDVYKCVDLTDGELRYHLLQAFQKNIQFYFPNYWTTLHLVIFYLIMHGYRVIHLIGCNLDEQQADCQGNVRNITDEQCKYAYNHTARMIPIAKEMGIEIVWHKSLEQFETTTYAETGK